MNIAERGPGNQLRVGLICADTALRQLAVKRVCDLAGCQLDWYCADAAQARRLPAVSLLLVAAGQCDREVFEHHAHRQHATLVAVARRLETDTHAIYAALDSGVHGYVELELLEGGTLAARLDRFRRSRPRSACPALIAIGASAGGPVALRELLSGLPADLPAAVLVVQHFEGERIDTLGRWLAPELRLPLVSAHSGLVPVAGSIFLAEGGTHLELDPSGQFQTSPRLATDLNCPSVDRLFQSLRAWPQPGIAVLLTGMGQDGAQGLLALRQGGWLTLTETAESATVDGMPRAARELDAASLVLPLARMSAAIVQALSARGRP